MKRIIFPFLVLFSFVAAAQDLTGTWEGDFITGINGQLQHVFKMRMELVQIENKVYGVVTRYPEDTKPTDEPNIIYRVSGKLGKQKPIPFLLIKDKVVESNLPGNGEETLYQFNVNYTKRDLYEYLSGKWFRELEPLVTSEKGSGTFKLRRVAVTVSDRMRLLQRSKTIIDTLNNKAAGGKNN